MMALGNGQKSRPGNVRPKIKGAYLTIYPLVPDHDFSLDEIVEFAKYRYTVHRALENLRFDSDGLPPEKVRDVLISFSLPVGRVVSSKINNPNVPDLVRGFNQTEADEFSFFSLLLFSLQDDDARRLFVSIERDIFLARLTQYESLTLADVPAALFSLESGDLDLRQFTFGSDFRIPFELVFAHLPVDTIDVNDGFVVVSIGQLRLLFAALYSGYLERKIANLLRSRVAEKDVYIVAREMYNQALQESGRQERQNWDAVTLDDIDALAHRSFPPCMYGMFFRLRERHKLFHEGRLQLGLFLKGIGLSLHDSLVFWQRELERVVGLDGFQKQYAYNIRYNYGKEGAGKSRSSYSCLGIIRHPEPAADQVHGCPFRQWARADLTALLGAMARDAAARTGRAAFGIQDRIAAMVDMGKDHPQVACKKWFELFRREIDQAPQRPIDYYDWSEDFLKAEGKD
jgi:DNA primase large subunit